MHLTLFSAGAAIAMSLLALIWPARSQPPVGAVASPGEALITAYRDEVAKAQRERLDAEQARIAAENTARDLLVRAEAANSRPIAPVFQPSPSDPAVEAIKIDANFREARLRDIFEFLGKAAGKPVQVEWQTIESTNAPLTAPITLRYSDISLPRLLAVLSDRLSLSPAQSLEARLADGSLIIASREYFDRREQTLASYDICGIIAARHAAYAEDRAAAVPEITKAILEFVSPDDWTDNGGDLARLQVVGDRLFVKAPARMHAQVAWILNQLPAAAPGRAAAHPASADAQLAAIDKTYDDLIAAQANVAAQIRLLERSLGPDHPDVLKLKAELNRITIAIAGQRDLHEKAGHADPTKGAEVRVYRLQNTSAADIAAILNQVFPGCKATADPRTNSVIVAGPAQDDVPTTVQELDRPRDLEPTVFLSGLIDRPGAFHMSEGLTLRHLLTAAGQFKPGAKEVLITRTQNSTSKVVSTLDLSTLSNPDGPDPTLQSGDLIVVR